MSPLFFFLLIFGNAYAGDVWVQFTGIDPINLKQNHKEFYEDHIHFLKACHEDPKRVCKAFINPDLRFLPDEDFKKLEGGKIQSAGNPTRASVLEEIKRVVQNAKKGEQVVISLNDHGAPSNESPSCIAIGMNSGGKTEFVCESDLRKIVGGLPEKNGFKLLVQVNGCYSGGFAQMASASTCVATATDQYQNIRR